MAEQSLSEIRPRSFNYDPALAPAGGDRPHDHLQPYPTLYPNIALQGVFPPRG